MRVADESRHGFTLIEVTIAGGLLAAVTAVAMIAYVAQIKLMNTQQQASDATDSARETIRLIGNDLRGAAPGISSAMIAGGANPACATGTIPFDPIDGHFGGHAACLPPIFRSSSPIAGMLPSVQPGATVWAPTAFCMGGGPAAGGFQLTVGPNQTEPAAGASFCPDDLVMVTTDASNAFFASNLPISYAPGTPVDVQLAFSQAAADGFDTGALQSLSTNPMLLLSGTTGPVLLCTGTYCGGSFVAPLVANPFPNVTDSFAASWAYTTLTLQASSTNPFANLGVGTPVALPARIVQYAVAPVDANGASPPANGASIVGGNLVRSVLLPIATAPYFAVLSSTVLVKGVVDMQVEFGYDPLGNGQLQYVSSGGYQETYWPQPNNNTTPPAPDTTYNACLSSSPPQGMSAAVCFPDQHFPYMRSVRVSLLVRRTNAQNARTQTALKSSTATAAPFVIQPAGQDLVNGNLEAQNWSWSPGGNFIGFTTIDGAQYREISTEVSVRNLVIASSY